MSRHRLYFFPALLPLASVLPFVLTAVSALAGATRFLKHSYFQSNRKFFYWLTAGLMVATLGSVVFRWVWYPNRYEGTKLTPSTALPKFDVVRELPAATRKKDWHTFSKHPHLSAPSVTKDIILVGTMDRTLEAYDRVSGHSVWTLRKQEPIYATPLVVETLNGDWIFLAEGLHTAIAASLTVLKKTNDVVPQVMWQREFYGHLESPPALDEKHARLFVATGPGGIWALSIQNGAVLWRADLGHSDVTPLLVGERLFVVTQPNERVAVSNFSELNPNTGKVVWQASLDGLPFGTPILSRQGTVLVWASNGTFEGEVLESEGSRVYGIDVENRKPLWKTNFQSIAMIRGAYSASRHQLFLGLKNGELVALSADTGATVWTSGCGAGFRAPPVLSGDRLASLSTDGMLCVHSTSSGKLLKKEKLSPGSTSSPVFDGNALVVATPGELMRIPF